MRNERGAPVRQLLRTQGSNVRDGFNCRRRLRTTVPGSQRRACGSSATRAARRWRRTPMQLRRLRTALIGSAHVEQSAESVNLQLRGAKLLMTATAALRQQHTLGGDRGARRLIIDRRQQRACLRIVAPAFDRQCALGRGRWTQVQRQQHARQAGQQLAQQRACAHGHVLPQS